MEYDSTKYLAQNNLFESKKKHSRGKSKKQSKILVQKH